MHNWHGWRRVIVSVYILFQLFVYNFFYLTVHIHFTMARKMLMQRGPKYLVCTHTLWLWWVEHHFIEHQTNSNIKQTGLKIEHKKHSNVHNSQCRIFCIFFLTFRIYLKSILESLEGLKTVAFAIFGALNFVNLVNFSIHKVQKCITIKIQSLFLWV